MGEQQHGVVFPADAEGRRSTTRTGREVVVEALGGVDPVGARAAAAETSWRSGYPEHFRRLVVAGLESPDDAVRIARQGLEAVHQRMRVRHDGTDHPLTGWPEDAPALRTSSLHGTAEPETELVLPYRGRRLRGDELFRRVDAWVEAGAVEPSVASAVRTVAENPDWLRLEGRTAVVAGATSEMGPLPSLLRWGARVAAIDLPREELWDRVSATASDSAGTLLMPCRPGTADLGADLLADVPRLARWLTDDVAGDGSLVVGNYVYADGSTNVRVATAVDELTRRLQTADPETAAAFLATPTDVFVVPGEAVAASTARYDDRSTLSRSVGRPLRTLSGGRLLQRQYRPGADPGINDSIVPQQGPNYVLAKRLQRWRATVARAEGLTVSMNVAPPTRTRSVVKNKALAAAYAGAHRFGVEVFDPATSAVLMAALLVHDLHTDGGPEHDHPWQDEAYAAAHGGLWRAAYAPRSALGLAAVLGVGGARG